jgi:nitroreductase
MTTPALPISDDTLLSALHWRYATKVFDPAKKIPATTWKTLEEALVLTPSSCGLQPWKFIVITDDALKAKLRPHAWGQSQVTDCSHFVVFAAELNVGEAFIDKNMRRIAEVRGSTVESLQGYRGMIVNLLVNGPLSKTINDWAAHQIYIALGNFMTAAALLRVDTCPMEGFVPAEYDKILGLPERGLTSAVCCAAGYRSAGDKYAALPKVRFSREDMVEHI